MRAFHVNVPARLNAASLRSLAATLSELPCSPVVLRGEQGSFCVGVDPTQLLESGAEEVQKLGHLFAVCLRTLNRHSAPTLAIVEGEALGGGLGLAAACDIVLARPAARFALPEVLYGLVPGIVLPYLLQRLSRQTVRRMAFAGLSLDVHAGLRLGLVDELLGADVHADIARWERMLSRADKRAVSALRSLLATTLQPEDDGWQEACVACSVRMQLSDESRAAMKGFVDGGMAQVQDRLGSGPQA